MPVSVRNFAGVEEASRALAASRAARFFGGGTLLMRRCNEGDQSFDTLIRASDPALKQIRPEGDRISIGAGVTMREVMASRDLGFLAPVARSIGGPAIRSMATVGGNLFAASPYGDFAVALLALDGLVHVAGGAGSGRGVTLEEFLRARDRDPRAVVTSVSVLRPRDPQSFRFVKASRIKPKGISVLSIAAYLPLSGGRVSQARIAYGAMAPTPIRVPAVERALEGKTLDAAGIAQALAVATERLEPPTDPIASTWYRREVAPVHLRRLLLGPAH
jgi:xanthine dehydrogenase small subunit